MQSEILNNPIEIAYCDLPNSGEVVIDCRSIDEFEVSHLNNAIHIPLQHLSIQKDSFPCNKDQTFFVYCNTGNRSRTFVTFLRSLGYTNCQSIAEGYEQWGNK
jgi:rhodanese-related sulfurtransferase